MYDSNNENSEFNKQAYNFFDESKRFFSLSDEGNGYRHFGSESAKEYLKDKCSLDDDTINFLSSYKNYDKLIVQIANKLRSDNNANC